MTGPFETEAEARPSPAVRAAYGAWSPGLGSLTGANHEMQCSACTAAGVELGVYDHTIIQWLAGYEPQMRAVVAGIISRANRLSAADLTILLDALDAAADYKRGRAANCPDCDADPADLCTTCEWRLQLASEYDAVARRFGGGQ